LGNQAFAEALFKMNGGMYSVTAPIKNLITTELQPVSGDGEA
jgi:hypothetical protein